MRCSNQDWKIKQHFLIQFWCNYHVGRCLVANQEVCMDVHRVASLVRRAASFSLRSHFCELFAPKITKNLLHSVVLVFLLLLGVAWIILLYLNQRQTSKFVSKQVREFLKHSWNEEITLCFVLTDQIKMFFTPDLNGCKTHPDVWGLSEDSSRHAV